MDEPHPLPNPSREPTAHGAPSVLQIGCFEHLPIQRLLAFLGALGLHAPQLEAQVRHDRLRELLRRLDLGELDLAIIHDTGDGIAVEIEPIFPGEQLAAFLPLGHPLARKRTLAPADVADLDLVIFPHAEDSTLVDRLLAEIEGAGYRFRAIVEAPGAHVRDVLLEVARGQGIAIAASSLAGLTDARDIVTRRALDPRLAMPDTVLAWSPSRSASLQQVLTIVRDVARDLRRGGRPTAGESR
jgi:DNA-binding transcriptional LysR family regulator